MTKTFDAKVEMVIHAPAARVWDVLTRPELVREYMHGTTVESDWKVGSPIRWSGEWQGKSYEDKGVILALEPRKKLSYTHWSSMGGSADKPENYHTVTFTLAEKNGETALALKQSNNPSREAADQMAQNNWKPMLEALKGVAEK